MSDSAPDDKCRAYLEDLRWPDCLRSPQLCEAKSISRIQTRGLFECNADSCRYQFSVTVGTVFYDSHLPLWKWFLAIYLMSESKKGISANQLKRTLDVTYKTAWFLTTASARDGGRRACRCAGIVEVDETWVGGNSRD